MDPNSSPFPGKSHPSNSKTNRNPTQAPKTLTNELPISRWVFGIVHNDIENILVINVPQKPIIKPAIGVTQKQPKSTKLKNSPEKAKPKLKKKSVLFPDQDEEKSIENVAVARNVITSRTPVASASETRLKIADTSYHSVENCSKCRIDRLATSLYWLGQIKLVESVGKHFVSAAFFRLAFEF